MVIVYIRWIYINVLCLSTLDVQQNKLYAGSSVCHPLLEIRKLSIYLPSVNAIQLRNWFNQAALAASNAQVLYFSIKDILSGYEIYNGNVSQKSNFSTFYSLNFAENYLSEECQFIWQHMNIDTYKTKRTFLRSIGHGNEYCMEKPSLESGQVIHIQVSFFFQ